MIHDWQIFSSSVCVAFSFCWWLPLLCSSILVSCNPTCLLLLLFLVHLMSYPKKKKVVANCQLKNNVQSKSWELCFIWAISEDLSLGYHLSDSSEGLFRRGKEGARIYRTFCKKKKKKKKKKRKKGTGSWTSKDYR